MDGGMDPDLSRLQGIEGMKGTLPLHHRVTRPLAVALNWRPRWTVGSWIWGMERTTPGPWSS